MTERNLRTFTWWAGLTFLACLGLTIAGWSQLTAQEFDGAQLTAIAVATGSAAVLSVVSLIAGVAMASLEATRDPVTHPD